MSAVRVLSRARSAMAQQSGRETRAGIEEGGKESECVCLCVCVCEALSSPCPSDGGLTTALCGW